MRYNMSLPYFTKIPFTLFKINQTPERGYHHKQKSISQTKKSKNIKNDSIPGKKKMKLEKKNSLPKYRDRNPIRKKNRLRNSDEDWKGQYLDSSLNELEWLKDV